MCYAQTSGVKRGLWGQCLAAPCRAFQVVGHFTEFLAHKYLHDATQKQMALDLVTLPKSSMEYAPSAFSIYNTRLIRAWNSWRTAALQQCSQASWTSVCCDFFPALFTNRCLCIICLQKSEQILLSCSGIPVSLPLDPVAHWFKTTTFSRSCKAAFPSYQLMFWTCNKSVKEKIAFFGSKYFFSKYMTTVLPKVFLCWSFPLPFLKIKMKADNSLK